MSYPKLSFRKTLWFWLRHHAWWDAAMLWLRDRERTRRLGDPQIKPMRFWRLQRLAWRVAGWDVESEPDIDPPSATGQRGVNDVMNGTIKTCMCSLSGGTSPYENCPLHGQRVPG